MNHWPEPEPANVLTSAELKRRGISAIELALQHGPVHLLKHNHCVAVVLSEQHFRDLQRRAAQAPAPQQSALEWLLQHPPATLPRTKPAIDTELAAERAW